MGAELAHRGLRHSSCPPLFTCPKHLPKGSPLHTGIDRSALAHASHPCCCVLQTISWVTEMPETSRRSVCCCTLC